MRDENERPAIETQSRNVSSTDDCHARRDIGLQREKLG
jgi:hypothetical protein